MIQKQFTSDERTALRNAVFYLADTQRQIDDPLGVEWCADVLYKLCEGRGVQQSNIELELEIIRTEAEIAKLGF